MTAQAAAPGEPGGDETRLWLYGVARRVLANQHRGGVRRDRLGARLRERLGHEYGEPGHVLDVLAVPAAEERG